MKTILALLLVLALAGCAGTMLPGKLYALADATELEFAIETSRGTGRMTARNPATGETFEGQYTGTYDGGGRTVSRVNTFDPMKPMNKSNAPGQGYTVVSNTTPDHATARGILRGSAGTVIELWLDIQPGLRPKGHGEGRDNKGQRYQVQF